MYMRLLDKEMPEEIFKEAESSTTKRRYLWCNDSSATGFVEYYTEGHARDIKALKTTGKVYP